MKKRSAWFAAWFAVLIIGVVAMMAVAPMGKAAEQKQFIVGFDAEFPPYGYMDDNGEYVGFDLDLAAEVCNRNGWKLVKRPIAWDSKDSELATGAISCIWNGFTMNGREDDYTWSTAYVDNSQVVIVKKDSNVHKLSDLKGKRLIVQSDSSALAALTGDDATKENKKLAASLKDLQQVADYNSAFMNLESGMVDAIAMDIGVASYQMSAKGDNFRMLDERLSSEEYGIGFKKGNTKLRDEVQKTLLTMLADGTFEQIVNKWGLKDSACLSEKDTTYIDGGKVPYVDFSKIQKKNDKTTEKSDGVKANKGGIWFIMKQLGSGMLATLSIFVFTLLFSLPLGLLIAAVRMSRFALLRWIAKIYISIMRGTPLMLQLLVVFFAPYYVFGISTPYMYRLYAVIIGFSLNYAAYFAEIYRSGIQSIPVGQDEAGMVLGMSKHQIFFRIKLLQMIKRILPPMSNEILTLVKDTSLARIIALQEVIWAGQAFMKGSQGISGAIWPLFFTAVYYLVCNGILTIIFGKIEQKLEFFK